MRLILCFFLSWCVLGGAYAADFGEQQPGPEAVALAPDPFFDEVRLGVYAHDPWSPETGSADLNIEVLFGKPWGGDADWWLPRPHVGAAINFAGKTSTVYAGASWQVPVTDWAFVEGTFGGSVNNGNDGREDPDMNPLGCPVLFRESASVGFDLTEHWRIMATVEHHSNAGLCDFNRGLTNAGLRAGYRF